MKVLKNNKGLVIFYLCMVVFTVFWALKVDENNDKIYNIFRQKNYLKNITIFLR